MWAKIYTGLCAQNSKIVQWYSQKQANKFHLETYQNK